jgi:hypothetical protein
MNAHYQEQGAEKLLYHSKYNFNDAKLSAPQTGFNTD